MQLSNKFNKGKKVYEFHLMTMEMLWREFDVVGLDFSKKQLKELYLAHTQGLGKSIMLYLSKKGSMPEYFDVFVVNEDTEFEYNKIAVSALPAHIECMRQELKKHLEVYAIDITQACKSLAENYHAPNITVPNAFISLNDGPAI